MFKKATLPGPAAPPTPLAGDAGIAGNGHADNRRYESAYQAGLTPGANAESGRQGQLTWDIPVRGEEAARQWGVSRADVAGENRNQLALPGGMGGMGIGGGGFIAGAYADGLDVGQPVANGGVAAGPVSGGVAGVPVSDLDADGGGGIREDGKLYGFRGDQAAQDSPKTLGAKANRRYSGRSALESAEGESVVLGQALNIAAAGEVASESLNGQIVRGFAADKSGQLVERGQSDVEPLYFQSELSRAETAALARGAVALGVVADDEVAKESAQAEAPALGDVPALGRMFKRGADPEKVARDLSAVQLERSADTKALSERGRASGGSARQSLSLAKQDKDRLSKLPVEEYESPGWHPGATSSKP